ncbi:UNVERIFIED_ORG: hypothetical protein J2W66_003817 [Agrobacterium larrymoorei]|jgi:hypothetical protein|uniref:hypothetical protein n=1 Tax=Agrobacterium cavarae TaxID=2528239 RepID=UPI000DDE7577|nr:hypothetical protein [Agrobacterium larrymoorei]
MTEIPDRKTFASRQTLGDADAWGKMMALAAMIEIDQATGAMTIRNGKSSLTLRSDGRVTVRGVRILQTAERNISLEAATIDLN